MTIKRRHFKQSDPLGRSPRGASNPVARRSQTMKRGSAREDVLHKARQAETDAHVSEWLRSPGLQAPQ